MATAHGLHLLVNYARAIPDMEEASPKSTCSIIAACMPDSYPTVQKICDEQCWTKTDTFVCLLVWNDDTKKL